MSFEANEAPQQVTYEQPLSERFRSFLRLELLLQQLAVTLQEEDPWHSRQSITTLAEIYSIIERNDLKTDIIKELERHSQFLAQLETNPAVDRNLLGAILGRIDALLNTMQNSPGFIGSYFKDHDFLSGVFQRSNIPGGTCSFDLPTYHHWLSRDSHIRNETLLGWTRQLEIVSSGIQLILKVVRESGTPTEQIATSGIFQHSLDHAVTCQLVRVCVPSHLDYFPEISGGKHRVSIRFLAQPDLALRPVQAREDVAFTLACCAM